MLLSSPMRKNRSNHKVSKSWPALTHTPQGLIRADPCLQHLTKPGTKTPVTVEWGSLTEQWYHQKEIWSARVHDFKEFLATSFYYLLWSGLPRYVWVLLLSSSPRLLTLMQFNLTSEILNMTLGLASETAVFHGLAQKVLQHPPHDSYLGFGFF